MHVRKSQVRSSGQAKHSFVEIGHDIISTVILSQLLIQVGQISITGERMCTKYWISLPRESVVMLTDRLDMTIVVDWDAKPQNKQTHSKCGSRTFTLFLDRIYLLSK